MQRRTLGAAALGALFAPALPRIAAGQPGPATAAPWPTRPITLVVSFAPGGSTDLVARVMAQQLTRELGVPVAVDNRTGASGTVGHASVARARPDGTTLLMGANSTYAMARHLFPARGYDDDRAFTGVGLVAVTPIFMCVQPALGVRTVPEFIALVRARPGALSYGSAGTGASGHLATEMFLRDSGLDMQNVTYRGGAPTTQALLTGEVALAFVDAITVLPHIAAGTLVGLGVASLTRSPFAPNVPTLAESGLPGFECESHFALMAPAGTPEPIIRRLHAATVAAMRERDAVGRLRQAALLPAVGTPEEFAPYLARESEKWGDVIATRGIRAE